MGVSATDGQPTFSSAYEMDLSTFMLELVKILEHYVYTVFVRIHVVHVCTLDLCDLIECRP